MERRPDETDGGLARRVQGTRAHLAACVAELSALMDQWLQLAVDDDYDSETRRALWGATRDLAGVIRHLGQATKGMKH